MLLQKIFCVPCDTCQGVRLEVAWSGSTEWNAASLWDFMVPQNTEQDTATDPGAL